jgi:hypothetical protein
MLTPDATLRSETVDDILDRIVNRVKAPLGAAGPVPGTRAGTPPSDDPSELLETSASENGSDEPNGRTRSRRRRTPAGAR